MAFEADNALEVLVCVTKKQVTSLVADLVQLLQTKLGSVAFLRKRLRLVENIPVRSLRIFLGQLMARDITLHPPPFSFTDVKHERANRMCTQERGPTEQYNIDCFNRLAHLLTDLLHTAQVITNSRCQSRMRSQNM